MGDRLLNLYTNTRTHLSFMCAFLSQFSMRCAPCDHCVNQIVWQIVIQFSIGTHLTLQKSPVQRNDDRELCSTNMRYRTEKQANRFLFHSFILNILYCYFDGTPYIELSFSRRLHSAMAFVSCLHTCYIGFVDGPNFCSKCSNRVDSIILALSFSVFRRINFTNLLLISIACYHFIGHQK